MLFNSLEFAVFLPLVLLGYFAVPRRMWRARKVWLLVASYVFYMSWSPAFGLLLLVSTVLDYSVGLALQRTTSPGARRGLVAASVVVNLGILAVFKYGNFMIESAAGLVRPWLGEIESPLRDVLLPVGISFYTFESLSYSIDVYRGLPAARSPLDFALFLAFFPHLVAGPIVRPGYFLPQLERPPLVLGRDVELALARIATGLVKKVLLADTLGGAVDPVFANPALYGVGNVAIAIYAYAFQIYFDFSGYTDIAIGTAMLFGLRLPENFARPYAAAGPREFWQRWHISLSTWLRDYLYVPLGGNRGSRGRMYANLLLTMVLGGLWHGAAWTFVAWGAYHGLLLVGERLLTGRRSPRERPTLAGRLVTFHLVCAGWVLFRAPSVGDAAAVVAGLLRPGYLPFRAANLALVLLPVAVLLHMARPAARAREAWIRQPPWLQGLAYAAAVVVVFLFSPATGRFIYFQF